MELKDYRARLDEIDSGILSLFAERMDIAGKIAAWKKENHMPVLDLRREKEKLRALEGQSPEHLREYTALLFSTIMELSRSRQNRLLQPAGPESEAIEKALRETPRLFPESAIVACQGTEGSASGAACERLFKHPDIFWFSGFEAVFSAVEKGLCRYGVIPVENSSAGTVNAVYDLMQKHDFHIVRSVRLKTDYNLLARPGIGMGQIRKIYAHSAAAGACAAFLQDLPLVSVIPCEDAASAARLVSESDDPGAAALSSRACARLYGLEIVKADVQDSANNYTRFLCISKGLEIYPGADRTSLMVILPHEPGSLYRLLSRFNALGINLTKLESRPIPERSFEFMFYFDFETSVYSPRFTQLMGELEEISEEYEYLGSYSEVI